MRVKELIKELQKLPQDARVWSQDEEGGFGYSMLVQLDADNEVRITAE